MQTILRNISGLVLPGESLGILGPSGAGKTTFLSILAGREMSSKDIYGNIYFGGKLASRNNTDVKKWNICFSFI